MCEAGERPIGRLTQMDAYNKEECSWLRKV